MYFLGCSTNKYILIEHIDGCNSYQYNSYSVQYSRDVSREVLNLVGEIADEISRIQLHRKGENQ